MTRDRLGAYGRALVAYLARKLVGTEVKKIAQYFRREPMRVSLGVRKIETSFQEDKDLVQRVEVMEESLRNKAKKYYFITIAKPHFPGTMRCR